MDLWKSRISAPYRRSWIYGNPGFLLRIAAHGFMEIQDFCSVSPLMDLWKSRISAPYPRSWIYGNPGFLLRIPAHGFMEIQDFCSVSRISAPYPRSWIYGNLKDVCKLLLLKHVDL